MGVLRSIAEIARYRRLLHFLVMAELKTRYRGSFFGLLWTVANPLLLTLVLWVVFSRFGGKQEDNYGLFLLSGLMGWIFFQQAVDQGLKSIIRNKALIQKIYIPKAIFPLATVVSNLLNLGFFAIAFAVVAVATSHPFTPYALLAIPAALMLFTLATGIALIASALTVFFKDVEHLSGVVLRALFYLTPIIYRPSIFEESTRDILKLNPVYFPVVAIRSALYDGVAASADVWTAGFGVAALYLFVGFFVFQRLEHHFVYYA